MTHHTSNSSPAYGLIPDTRSSPLREHSAATPDAEASRKALSRSARRQLGWQSKHRYQRFPGFVVGGLGQWVQGGNSRGPTTEERDLIEPGMEDFDHTDQVSGIGRARHYQFQKHLADCPCNATREEALALGALGPLLV